MNKVNLNEYILEGIGEMHSLIAHEVQMLFNNQNRRFDFLRLSNQHFSIIDLKKRDLIIEVHYKYLISQDVWKVDLNDVSYYIKDGRSKTVSEITDEMIELIVSFS